METLLLKKRNARFGVKRGAPQAEAQENSYS
jgi:hypothetical protein